MNLASLKEIDWECSFCHHKFETQKDVTTHLNSINECMTKEAIGKPRFFANYLCTCLLCEKIVKTEKEILLHLREEHNRIVMSVKGPKKGIITIVGPRW